MDEPRLVKKDGDRVTPSEAPLSRTDFMEAVRLQMEAFQAAMLAQNAAQSEKTDALAVLLKKSKEEFERNDQNYLRTFKNISAFNPRGENALEGGIPRDPIKGEILWVGTRMIWHECTYDEIKLLNQLESGDYHNGEWVVKDMEPTIKGSRKLYVQFPNMDPDKRANLPSGYWDFNARDDDGTVLLGQDLDNPNKKGRMVTGVELMLREMIEEAKSRVPVPA